MNIYIFELQRNIIQKMSNWKTTAQLYEGLIDRPKMSEKLLSKPPFKYLFDIIMQTSKKTGFAEGLYQGDELKPDHYGQKSLKISYLNKIITLVEAMEGKKVAANPQKIVAGMEPDHTNEMLQMIHKCATSGKSSEPYVKKVLGISGAQQTAQAKPEKKKIERPPSAAKNKKVEQPPQQAASRKNIEKAHQQRKQQQPVEHQPQQQAVQQRPKKGQQYSKKVKQLMQEGEQEVKKQKQQQANEQRKQGNIQMGRVSKKKRQSQQKKLISNTGQLSEKQLELVRGMIQSICQNTAPLGKSIQFINDDIESMNRELQFWRKQYHASKNKMQNELKVTQQALLPIYDKLGEIEEQIKDQRQKIQTTKAQIIKNDSTIQSLLMAVVATK